jgi:hypothetical protein
MKKYSSGASTKGAGSCATSAIKGLAPRSGATNTGPGPKIPAGAPPPSSKGSISYPKSAVGGSK